MTGMPTAGIDSYQSSRVAVTDVTVHCDVGGAVNPYSMGIAIRASRSVVVSSSHVSNCHDEAYFIEAASNNTVQASTADCADGFLCRNAVAIIGRDDNGIDAPADSNSILQDTLAGRNFYRSIIEVYGGGPTQFNTIEANGINGADHHGILLDSWRLPNPTQTGCTTPVQDPEAHGHIYLHNNSIYNTGRLTFSDSTGQGGVGIWLGSNSNTLMGNWIIGSGDQGIDVDFPAAYNSITNGRIWQSKFDGVYGAGPHTTVTNNDISYNGHYGVCLRVGGSTGNALQWNAYTSNAWGNTATSTKSTDPLGC